MLDVDGDLIQAVETLDGEDYETIGIALGSIQVAQAASLRVSTRMDTVWFNRAVGIDFDGLYYNSRQSDDAMNPVRASAFRDAIRGTPGFGSFPDNDNVVFTRTARGLEAKLPCFVVDCDSSRVIPAIIG